MLHSSATAKQIVFRPVKSSDAYRFCIFSNGRALKKNGGPGIAQTKTAFGPMLVKAGVSEALRQILNDNSRRFLAFVPKSGARELGD